MARRKRIEPGESESAPKEPKTDTIRVETEVAEMVTFVAMRRKVSVSDLMTAAVRQIIEPEYRKEVLAMHASLAERKSRAE